MPFLPPKQHRQSTEGAVDWLETLQQTRSLSSGYVYSNGTVHTGVRREQLQFSLVQFMRCELALIHVVSRLCRATRMHRI